MASCRPLMWTRWPNHLPAKCLCSHSQTTRAKCSGAPCCIINKSLIFTQVLTTGQISSYSMVRYLSPFMELWEMEGPSIISEVIPHHTITFGRFWNFPEIIWGSSLAQYNNWGDSQIHQCERLFLTFRKSPWREQSVLFPGGSGSCRRVLVHISDFKWNSVLCVLFSCWFFVKIMIQK